MVTRPPRGDSALLSNLRGGLGLAVRQFSDNAPFVLGGAAQDYPRGLANEHDDGDALCFAVLEALLSACGMPDVGTLFPPDDPDLHKMGSLVLLSDTTTGLYRQRLEAILNLSVQVACAACDLGEERQRIREILASALELDPNRITINLSREQLFSAVESGDALAAFANVLVVLKRDDPQGKKQSRVQAPLDLKATAKSEHGPSDEELAGLPERARQFEKAVKSKLPPLPKADPPQPGANLIVYTDGASKGNPGPASTGWVVLNEMGALVAEGGTPLGDKTNNEAEYLAVLEVAKYIEQNLGREFKLSFRLDSLLVVNQINGKWKIKDARMKQLAMQVMNHLMYFESFEMTHVPREENQRADALANQALIAKK